MLHRESKYNKNEINSKFNIKNPIMASVQMPVNMGHHMSSLLDLDLTPAQLVVLSQRIEDEMRARGIDRKAEEAKIEQRRQEFPYEDCQGNNQDTRDGGSSNGGSDDEDWFCNFCGTGLPAYCNCGRTGFDRNDDYPAVWNHPAVDDCSIAGADYAKDSAEGWQVMYHRYRALWNSCSQQHDTSMMSEMSDIPAPLTLTRADEEARREKALSLKRKEYARRQKEKASGVQTVGHGLQRLCKLERKQYRGRIRRQVKKMARIQDL
jgi:hypothetical protein